MMQFMQPVIKIWRPINLLLAGIDRQEYWTCYKYFENLLRIIFYLEIKSRGLPLHQKLWKKKLFKLSPSQSLPVDLHLWSPTIFPAHLVSLQNFLAILVWQPQTHLIPLHHETKAGQKSTTRRPGCLSPNQPNNLQQASQLLQPQQMSLLLLMLAHFLFLS